MFIMYVFVRKPAVVFSDPPACIEVCNYHLPCTILYYCVS